MRELEFRAISFIRENATENTVVSISGGKDSLVALDLSIRAGLDRAVFCDTTIEFRETVEYIKFLKDFYGIKIDIVRAPKDFFEIVQKVGFPSRRRRWCCDVFKFAPLAKYALENNIDAFITGLRKDESVFRSSYITIDRNPLVPVRQLNPILEWSERDVWNYIKKYALPINPLYKYFKRLGCWCCPFKTKEEWEKIKRYFPELYNKLKKELLRYAEKLGIKDQEKFVDKFGWTSWASPIDKFYAVFSNPCDKGKPLRHLVFMDEQAGMAVAELLPILCDMFEIHENGKIICIPINIPGKKLNILIEKAINCIGCGACSATCKSGALSIKDGHLKLNRDKCTHCLSCLNTNLLKGACIVRNYAPKRATIFIST